MTTTVKPANESISVKRYKVQHPVSAYQFPGQALIHQVRFDPEYIHVELIDGRRLSVPLWWIPTLHEAPTEEREKYEISRDRTMLVWDPGKCQINDEFRVTDYLCPVCDQTAG